MRSTLPTDVPPYFWTIRAIETTRSDQTESERSVGAAESERVRQCRADLHVTRDQRDEIEIALRVLFEEIRGRRCDLMVQRQHGEHRFDAARGTEQMTRHRFGRADGH